MSSTIGLVANVYQESNALPGWLETHLPYFDDVRVVHAGPQDEYSTDGTIEILEKWHIPIKFCAIDDGFGVVRTKAVRFSPCDWVMVLDADERFYPIHRVITCEGEATPQEEVDLILCNYDTRDGSGPNWRDIARLGSGLRVTTSTPYNQGDHLRTILETDRPDVVCAIRRHWHDLTLRRPTQNWHLEPDWQMRIVRNHTDIYFDPATRMHERLIGVQKVSRADMMRGPFFEHFHFWVKKLETSQRAHDVAIYDSIHEGKVPPTKEEYDRFQMDLGSETPRSDNIVSDPA